MGKISNILHELKFIRTSKRMLKSVKDIDANSLNLVPDDIERSVDKFANNLAFIMDKRRWTYSEFDKYANRVAHWASDQGCKPGDTVAIFARNRLEYVALWFGLSKIGVIPALLNYQIRANALAHCVSISSAKLVIVDHELMDEWQSCVEFLDESISVVSAFGRRAGFPDFDFDIASQATSRPAKDLRANIVGKNVFMKMFTSGTTGLPKAAKVTHTRAQYYLRGFTIPAKCSPKDRVLMVLPLYHATGGLCGVGMALMKGGGVIVRPKFSVSTFWDEAIDGGATLCMYVGELCRFLLNSPPSPQERSHTIRCIVGNGLGVDVWSGFVERFGIDQVVEFYGATEGNISLINFDGPAGAVGRLPEYMRDKLNGDIISYDVKTGQHIKGADGFCRRTETGEIGELIGEIREGETRFRYDGYEDKQASAKKILRSVFKKNDMWFRTGDLLSRDERGYCYFSDRIGDTYRWKAENVSTGEVAAVIAGFNGVHQANVYGVLVSGYDGRAGMASLVADENIDLNKLRAHIYEGLPNYARPLFLRISLETETTSTFKYKKTNLVKDGFNPSLVKDTLLLDHPKKQAYVKLGHEIYGQIQAQDLKF